MLGAGDLGEEHWGVIPRICRDILLEVKELLNSSQVSTDESQSVSSTQDVVVQAQVTASFLEIYNERVYDLLSPTPDNPCRIREHPTDGAYVENLTRRSITQYDDVESILSEGQRKR